MEDSVSQIVFLLFFIMIAAPGALMVTAIAAGLVKWLRLMPEGMSFFSLLLPTMALAAGGATMLFMLEEFVLRPIQLQNELVGSQVATPLSLRSYQVCGFENSCVAWRYEIDSAEAARLARACVPDAAFHRCTVANASGDQGRDAYILLQGTILTIHESFM